MTCPSLATSLINHGLKNDKPSAVKDIEKSRMVVSAFAGLVLIHTEQLAAFHYHTDGHVPMAYNVGSSASSAALPQVYPAVTCSISAPPPSPCKIQFSIRDFLNNIINCISQHQPFANHQFVL